MKKSSVTLNDVRESANRIRPHIRRTPLLRQKNMDQTLGCAIWLKPEMLQITGAFKLRGALSKILTLPPEERAKGIITSSSGNHGQACAYAGRMLGIPVTVVLPEDTPTIKVENARAMGATVILWDRKYDERWKKVRQEVTEHGYTIVHPYEDYTVMAGQGTIALEILEDLPEVDVILVPVGGGGLISGIATAIKESVPRIRVIGVQADASAAYFASRKAGKPVEVECLPTIADGLSCRRPGENPYPIVEKYVDDLARVTEGSIREAVKLVARSAKLVAEPSACVGIAALLSGAVKTRPGEKVCTVLTSGNWNVDMVGKILNDEPVEGVL